ncbi:MAG: ferric reductase-like transmembrane domain-containing protein, partial [Actinomycetota bacterium]
MNEEFWWYATRAAGLMTWTTAVASVIVGLLLSTRVVKSKTGPWMLDLHRFLGGISVLFLLVHMGTLWADSFVDFGPRELLIPGESSWEPEAAAWGVIAAWTLVLVEVTSLMRKRISKSLWRTFHMLSIVTVLAGSYHAWLGGTDVDNPLTWLIAGAGSAIVVGLVAVRLRGSETPSSPRIAKANDREALLAEMRDRLESLPVPENTAQPELATDGGALPRRAPVTMRGAEIEVPEPAPTPVTADAVPAAPVAVAEAPAFPVSTADPFGDDAPFDPFNVADAPPAPMPGVDPVATPDPFAAAPLGAVPPVPQPAPPAPQPDGQPWGAPSPASTGYDDIAIAGRAAPDPFGRGHAEPPVPPSPPAPPAPEPTPSPFGETMAPAPGETPIAPQAAPFFEPTPPPGSHADTPFPAASPFVTPAPTDPPFDPNSPFGSEPPPPVVTVPPAPEPPMAPLQNPANADLFPPATPA